ncbi:MAG: putative ABC transport system ATP-binding protein [Kangiellaceae bacterium]|jgi:putative ABC transport system ATP-binding protein
MDLTNETNKNQQPELAIKLENMSYKYDKTRIKPDLFVANWQVDAGQHLFLRGESGSGKTTLLNLLAGVLVPDSGKITLLGEPFSQLSPQKIDAFRAKHIGVVYQQFNLIPFVSVLKNVQLAAHFGGTCADQVEQTLADLLPKLALSTDCLGQAAGQLSVGQQQRVAIARALINHPDILLVDEPTSALDSAARDAFMEVLLTLCNKFNTTLLFVSHDPHLQQFFKNRVNIAELNTSQGDVI